MPSTNAPIRGRGASDNPANRFESVDYERHFDDLPEDALVEPRPETVFIPDRSKTILASNDSPDVSFDRSINPYRGCEHGCVYCYARPTHEYLGFSAGLDFETRIMVKEEAPALLDGELRKASWHPQVIGISGVTDPYQPAENGYRLTRGCLQVLASFRNPAVIITKNRLVARDVDVLKELAKHGCVGVYISMTTLDLGLNRILEPRTSSPAQRLDTIARLRDAGIPVGALVAPVIPGLNDQEIPEILRAVAAAGGSFASFVSLRLPLAVAPLFERWLEQHFPERKDKVLNRVRTMGGGELYKSEFRTRMRGEGLFAEQIANLFHVSARKAGIPNRHPAYSTSAFRVPPRAGDQLSLLS